MTGAPASGAIPVTRRRFRLAVAPTTRGLGIVVTTVFLYAAAVLVDTTTLLSLAAVSATALAAALLVMTVSPRAMALRRTVSPGRVRAGTHVRVLYDLSVRASTLLPVPRVVESVRYGGRTAERLTLSGGVANRTIAVDLPTLARGVHLLGPTSVTRTDPLGLFRHDYEFDTADEVIVWPTTVAVYAALAAAGLDGRATPLVAAGPGYEFRGLREFVAGDDKRRIHWASSAKRQTLLVRENDPDIIETATVVLDLRDVAYLPVRAGDDAFETAVSAAASAVEVLVAIGWQVRLVLCTPGAPVLEVDAPKLLGTAMDRLAGVARAPEGDPGTAVYEMVSAVAAGPSGPLVYCGGTCDGPLAAALSGPLSRRRRQLLVLCDEERATHANGTRNPALARLSRPNRSIATPAGLADLAGSWYAATAASHGGAARPSGRAVSR